MLKQIAVALAALLMAAPAFATDHLTVAKSGTGLVYAAMDVGLAHDFFKKNGLDITVLQLPSAAASFAAITGGTTDITLGSGTSMGFSLKGVPQMAVATLTGPPFDFTITVDPKGPIKTLDDLKGKSVAVTSAGSLTYWFVKQLALMQGWGNQGVTPQPIGSGTAAQFAAMVHGDVQGIVATPEAAADYAERGQAKVLMNFGDVFKTFQTHTIFASNKLIAEKPEVVERFLKGWFESVRYMVDPAHHAECVKLAADQMNISIAAAESAFVTEMKGMSRDGAFDTAAIDIVRKSLPDSGILPTVPEAKDLYNGKFVPVKLD